MSRAELSFKLPPASVPTFNDISPGKREKWKYLHLLLPFPRFSRNCDLRTYTYTYIYIFLYRSFLKIFFFFFILKNSIVSKRKMFKRKLNSGEVHILIQLNFSGFISILLLFIQFNFNIRHRHVKRPQNCIYFYDLLISTLITLQLPLEGFSIIGFLRQFLLSSTLT